MLVDKMHTLAIEAADESGLPMTVYRIGNEWKHSDADWMRRQVMMPNTDVVQVVTWLPSRFFVKENYKRFYPQVQYPD